MILIEAVENSVKAIRSHIEDANDFELQAIIDLLSAAQHRARERIRNKTMLDQRLFGVVAAEQVE